MISPIRDWTCTACDATGGLLIMEGPGPLCLACADMDHLVFLASGDAALTRRAKASSRLSAVVVRFSRSRRRYVSTLRVMFFVSEYHRLHGGQRSLLQLARGLRDAAVAPVVLFPGEGRCSAAFRAAGMSSNLNSVDLARPAAVRGHAFLR